MEKIKNNRLLIICLVITIIILSSCNFNVIKGLSDDNYSTYLYNQNINVDNDKAHLLSEQSDGSNSYRNIFQSNFLFPAKLQSNMLSTSATSLFSHYSFNQFYFDNLDNNYAYKSNDNSENFIESIVPNDFEVEKGSNIVNGSLENQDSSFGKYNSTYNFDDYNTSIYGNYYGSYSFDNDTIGINYDVRDDSTIQILDTFDNHNTVLELVRINNGYTKIYTSLNYETNGIIEYYFSINDTLNYRLQTAIYGNVGILGQIYVISSHIYLLRGGGTTLLIANPLLNHFYHVKWKLDCSIDKQSVYIDDVIKANDVNFYLNVDSDTINEFNHIIGVNGLSHFDAFGYNKYSNYNENENTNPYGLQKELENDSYISYRYGSSISIVDIGNYRNNILNLTNTNGIINYPRIKYDFISKTNETIEFSMLSNDVSKQNTFTLQDDSYRHAITFGFISDCFKYYDSGWETISGIVPLNDVWYDIKIKFSTIIDKWNLTINDVNYLINQDLRTDYGINWNTINYIQFFVYTSSNNQYLIDNLDFSWTNGYYENRIQDLIPLNDSNYNMYKNENRTDSKYITLLPNQDILTEWSEGSVSGNPHYTYIDEYPNYDSGTYLFTSGYGYHHDIIGFQSGYNRTYNKIVVKISCYLYGSTSKRLEIAISDISDFSNTYDYYPVVRSPGYFSAPDTITFNQTITNIDDLEISFQKMDNVGYQFFITQIYVKCYYDDLELSITTEKNIDYNENGKPVLNTLYYSMCGNLDYYFSLYVYNYDLNSYYLIKNYSSNKIFNTYSFEFNESAYFRLNKFKLKIFSNNTFDYNFFIDLLALNITYIKENNNGYHEIISYNQRYDDSDTYKGYSRFELQIHNDSLKYRYSEINLYTDDYIYSWSEINTSLIQVNNIELQSHIRYGLNTLDVEIINFYYIIYINYDDNLKIEFMEQSRKELDCHKIKSSFNYTTLTRNYLNLTGIIGNYSYNVFKGCRSLYGLTSEIFHRYFTIPYFSDDIDVSIYMELPDDIISNPDEPEPPTEYYWTYETFRTEYYQTSYINIGNWTVEFKSMKSVSYQAKYFYQPESISKDDLGSWKWKIKFTDAFSYTVNFNFMRNAIKTVLNLILLFFQFIFYLVIASLSYFLMFIGTNILVFIWNILVYHVFYALIYVLWYLYEGLYLLLDAIWLGLVWFYENYLIPFYVWFTEIAIPYLVEFIIIPAIAFTLTLVIWIITLGNVDFWILYDTIHEQLLITSDIVIDIIMELVDNIVIIIYFIALYVLLTLMCFLKHIICKARGYTNRSNSLYDSFEVYIYPIILFYNLCMKIKDLLAQWV